MGTEPALHIVFEDNYLLVVNKPHGLQCEPDKMGHPDLCTALRRELNRQNRPPKLLQPVNRLDRPVGGLVLFAKTATALRTLNRMQEARQIQKTYEALVEGIITPTNGTLEHFLAKNLPEKRAEVYTHETEGAKRSLLDYSTREQAAGNSRLHILLKTGRYHQIRAQLAFTGHPVLGDAYYGARSVYAPDAICLHARQLRFAHPILGTELLLQVPPAF